MDTISGASDSQRLLLSVADKNKLKEKPYICYFIKFQYLLYAWKKIKSSCKNNTFKILAPTWNEEFELPDKSYTVSDNENYFEYSLKNMGKRLIILQ